MIRTFAAVVLVNMLLVGCSGKSHELEVAPVKGSVLLDGKPLSSGVVLVMAAEGRMARGVLQEDGTFELTTYDKGDGAPVGTHPVMIKPMGVDEGDKSPPSKIPFRYHNRTSKLKITVVAGETNSPVIKLTTKR